MICFNCQPGTHVLVATRSPHALPTPLYGPAEALSASPHALVATSSSLVNFS